MQKYIILFNTINIDGLGDLSHFIDVVEALRATPSLRNFEFILAVQSMYSSGGIMHQKIIKKLDALQHPYLCGKRDDHKRFLLDETLQARLANTELAMTISYGALSEQYEPYMKKNVPSIFIGEHDSHGEHSLGFNGSGLKVQDFPPVFPADAWRILQEHDALFAEKLLEYTGASDAATLLRQHAIVPAYFSNREHFLGLLRLFATNAYALSCDKDIVIYYSGRDLNQFFSEYDEALKLLFKGTQVIGSIEIMHGDAILNKAVFDAQTAGSKTIRIITGFYLSEPSFDAIYQLASMAGVSGDNTFERCISMQVFPYYYSTNIGQKAATYKALHSMMKKQEIPNISAEAYEAYIRFYDVHVFRRSGYIESLSASYAYAGINLAAMIEAWPKVARYIKEHHNFYDRLENMVLEALGTPKMITPITSNRYYGQITSCDVSSHEMALPTPPSLDTQDMKANGL